NSDQRPSRVEARTAHRPGNIVHTGQPLPRDWIPEEKMAAALQIFWSIADGGQHGAVGRKARTVNPLFVAAFKHANRRILERVQNADPLVVFYDGQQMAIARAREPGKRTARR